MNKTPWAIPGVRRFTDEEMQNERRAIADPETLSSFPYTKLDNKGQVCDAALTAPLGMTPDTRKKLEGLRRTINRELDLGLFKVAEYVKILDEILDAPLPVSGFGEPLND
jgi:hypothetical protein